MVEIINIYFIGIGVNLVIESLRMGYTGFETPISEVLETAIFWPLFLIGVIGALVRMIWR